MRSPLPLAWAAALALASSPILPAAAQDVSPDPRAQAAEHFDRGITFFNEERYDAALAELARAHELAPAPATLYNLARVHAALGHAVQASEAYEAYLREGAETIGEERRVEVETALEEQRGRIGTLRVESDVPGATVAVDGVDVATTPLTAPLRLSAGSHTVEVRAPGHETVRRGVSIAGQTETALSVSLREEVIPRGTLRVTTTVPEVGIAVDGEPVGVTPLASTLALREGEHVVRATRPGYRTEERRVSIEEGAEAELELDMRRDPRAEADEIGRVRLDLPDAPYLVRVNGEQMVGDLLELPVGSHEITLEVTDRQTYQGTLRVPAGSTIVVVPPLAWTLDAREERLAAARSQRTAGIVMAAAGALTLGVGVALLVWNEGEIERTDARIIMINDLLMGGCALDCDGLREEGMELASRQDGQNALRGTSIALSVLGAGLTSVGLGLWIAAPSDDDVDAAAGSRARLELGPGGATLRGRF